MDKGLFKNQNFPGRYDEVSHGSIEDYLTLAKEANATPEFRGYGPYEKMLEMGILQPGRSIIRLERKFKKLRGGTYTEETATLDYLVTNKKIRGEPLIERIGGKDDEDSKEFAKIVLRRHSHNWYALHLAEFPTQSPGNR